MAVSRDVGTQGHAIDGVLRSEGMQAIDTVANTIFPDSMWNPAAGRLQLFERYEQILPVLLAQPKNRRGLYFERMIRGGPPGKENQLDFALSTYTSRAAVRRSALQVATFDPSRDHSTSAQLGFPCLQHVTFAPSRKGLSVNAFYASQYLVERGYGNYLGLAQLGRFVAHELGVNLSRLTCLVGIGKCEVSKRKVAPVLRALDAHMAERESEEE